MSISRFVCCCLLIVTYGYQAQAAETPLVWKFAVGDEHHYRMSQNMDMEMSLGDADRQIATGVQEVLDMTWKIAQVADQGEATIVQRVTRVQMDMQAPGQLEMHYDTDSEVAPSGYAAMLVPLYKAMTTEPFQMTITPRGEIRDFEMPEALAEAMKAIPSEEMMGELFIDEGFQNMIQQSSLILPELKDLSPGHEWTQVAQMKYAQLGVVETVTTYGYLGPREVEGKLYEAFSIRMKIDFGEAPDGVQLEVVSHASSGEILFSRVAGRLESSKLQQEIELKILAGSQEIAQKMVQTRMLERVELKLEEQEP